MTAFIFAASIAALFVFLAQNPKPIPCPSEFDGFCSDKTSPEPAVELN